MRKAARGFLVAINAILISMPITSYASEIPLERKLPSVPSLPGVSEEQAPASRQNNTSGEVSDNRSSTTAASPTWAPDNGGGTCESRSIYKTNFLSAANKAEQTIAGSPEHLEWTNRAVEAGYCLVWDLLDKRASDEADQAMLRMQAWLKPYDKPVPVATARLSLARYAWLRSRIAQESGNVAVDDAQTDRVLSLTTDREAYLPDWAPLSKMRIVALWKWKTIEEREKRQAEACRIAREFEDLQAGSLTRRTIECIGLEAEAALNQGNEEQLVDAVKRAKAQYASSPSIAHALAAMSVRIFEADLANKKGDLERASRIQIEMLEELPDIFENKSYFQQTTTELFDVYTRFSCECINNLPEYSDYERRYRKTAEIYSKISDALQASIADYPLNLSYASVAADSASIAANALGKVENWQAAAVYAERAAAISSKANILGRIEEFSEQGAIACKAYGKALEVQVGLNSISGATALNASLDTNCGQWLQRFPWDFYARSHFISAKTKVGIFFADKGNYGDALPILQYASLWGVKEATKYLAKLYGDVSNPFSDPTNAEKAAELETRQGMKRFTVPTSFRGVKYPFNVYITEYGDAPRCPSDRALRPDEANCVGFIGINDQVTWVKEARGGIVPPDVVGSFDKLYKIAEDNNVSFPELCVYALGAASEAGATDAQATVIHAEMVKTGFKRNPDRWLDSAGLALKGYDPVSYSQGSEPKLGNADFFTLWDGALWLFESAANREVFIVDPKRFAPQYGGYSATEIAMGEASGGDPKIFTIIDGRLFLFDSDKHIPEWQDNASELTAKADTQWENLFPTPSAPDSPLSTAVTKIGSIAFLSRVELYSGSCERSGSNSCTKLFKFLIYSCSVDDSIPACDAAILIAEKLETNAQLVSLLGSRSWNHALANRPDSAIADAKRALEIDPNQPWIQANLANGLLMNGEVTQAIAIYKTQQDKPGPGEGLMCSAILGDIEAMLGKELIERKTADRIRAEIVCP